jgi:hypothetical protein
MTRGRYREIFCCRRPTTEDLTGEYRLPPRGAPHQAREYPLNGDRATCCADVHAEQFGGGFLEWDVNGSYKFNGRAPVTAQRV